MFLLSPFKDSEGKEFYITLFASLTIHYGKDISYHKSKDYYEFIFSLFLAISLFFYTKKTFIKIKLGFI